MARRIEALTEVGHDATQIYAELVRLGRLHDDAGQADHENLEAAPWSERDVPDLRTIQRAVGDLRLPEGEPWTLCTNNADQAAAILPILAAVIREHSVRVRLSCGQAEWLWTVRKIAPDLPPWWTYRVGMALLRRSSTDAPTADIQAWLAFRPWASDEDSEAYSKAIEAGLVPGSPFGDTDRDRIAEECQLMRHEGEVRYSPDEYSLMLAWVQRHTSTALELRGHDPVVSDQAVIRMLKQLGETRMSPDRVVTTSPDDATTRLQSQGWRAE